MSKRKPIPPSVLAMTTNRSGQTVRASGIYRLYDITGEPYDDAGEFTLTKGEPFPPVPHPHLVFGLVRLTQHGHRAADAPDTDTTDTPREVPGAEGR